MSNCAVASCRNNYKKTKGLGISYHPFPKDPFLRKVWVNKCKRKDKFNPNHSGICSAHFETHEYEANKQNELLGIAYKKPLKKTAIPTLNLTQDTEEECAKSELPDSNRNNRYKLRGIKRGNEEQLQNISPKISPKESQFENNKLVNSKDEEILRLSQELKEVKQDLQIYKDKYKMAQMKIDNMIKVHVAAMRQQRKLQRNLLDKLKKGQSCGCKLNI